MFGRVVDKEVRMPSPLVYSNSHFYQKKTRKEHTETGVIVEHEEV